IERYQTTSHTPEALYRLVEAYLTLGLAEEAKRNGAVLGYNYPGDVWYRDAYKLLTDKGLRPAVEPSQSKKPSLVSRLPFVKDKDATIKPPVSEAPAAPTPEATPMTEAAPAVEAPAASVPAAEPAPSAPKAEQRRGLLSRIPGLGGDK
ncbi:MAG: outer membrane protein assembly factor BamD, partial [Phenylobacterium sp.]